MDAQAKIKHARLLWLDRDMDPPGCQRRAVRFGQPPAPLFGKQDTHGSSWRQALRGRTWQWKKTAGRRFNDPQVEQDRNEQGRAPLEDSNGKRTALAGRKVVAPVASGKSSQTVVVLIVEDEPILRMNMAESLEEAGFTTIEAPNADEAVAFLEARRDIRIVFTDINMPGSMDGLKLAEAVRDRWPPIELILTSGKRQLSQGELPDRGRFFPKPYNPEDVVAAVREFIAN